MASPPDITYADAEMHFERLEGVEADVAAYSRMVRSQAAKLGTTARITCRQSPSETTVLGLMDGMRAAAGRCHAGDLLVVVLCGHGFQRPDEAAAKEPDGLNEVFACSNGPLLDNFFPQMWRKLDTGAAGLVIVDACAADTFGLAIEWPELEDIPVPLPSCTWSGGPPRIALAACPSWGVARESLVGTAVRGTFSAHLERALAQEPTSYLKWFSTTVQMMGQVGLVQVPGLRYVGPRPQAEMLGARPFTTLADRPAAP